MAVAEVEDERRAIDSADEWIGHVQRAVEAEADAAALDADRLPQLKGTMREVALRISAEVVPELDDDAANRINQRLISMLSLDPDETDVLAAADHYLVDLEAVRHILRVLLDEGQPRSLRRKAGEVIATLEAWLPSVGGAELAELLGLSVRQMQRRRNAEGPASAREQLVARLVAILRHAWTDAGVVAWFHRPRVELGDAAPIDLLGDPALERELLTAARSGRVQGGG